ncbi:MAG TPA: serine/threonine-protein kinase [Gaiellaceae bacterium]|nr:serine/threonine-protein kinase [Gaiellaceae bacterium]
MTAYRVDGELGRGGMAVVYAGYHEGLGRPVALKVLAEHLADNPEFRARFLREARIAAALEHPHLVRTYDVSEYDGRPCIVMELLLPGTLEGGLLTRREAAQVADALAYAHRSGVVHRDLKPANLLRSSSGEVKIADFGIARAAAETMLTQAGTVLGTLHYLAPEQAEGRPVGPPADVYSLGVVLQELLEEADPALVAWCLARDPDDRPTAAEVAAALADAPTVVAGRRGVRHLRVSDTVRWSAAALAVAATATLVVVLSHDSKRPKVQPVPHATTPAQEARNLEAWLRRYTD